MPHTRAEVELTGDWTQTLDGRDFVLANDSVDDRLIIFGTVQNLRLYYITLQYKAKGDRTKRDVTT